MLSSLATVVCNRSSVPWGRPTAPVGSVLLGSRTDAAVAARVGFDLAGLDAAVAERCALGGDPLIITWGGADRFHLAADVEGRLYVSDSAGDVRRYRVRSGARCALDPDATFGEQGVLHAARFVEAVQDLVVDRVGRLFVAGPAGFVRVTNGTVEAGCAAYGRPPPPPLGVVQRPGSGPGATAARLDLDAVAVAPSGDFALVQTMSLRSLARVDLDPAGCRTTPWAAEGGLLPGFRARFLSDDAVVVGRNGFQRFDLPGRRVGDPFGRRVEHLDGTTGPLFGAVLGVPCADGLCAVDPQPPGAVLGFDARGAVAAVAPLAGVVSAGVPTWCDLTDARGGAIYLGLLVQPSASETTYAAAIVRIAPGNRGAPRDAGARRRPPSTRDEAVARALAEAHVAGPATVFETLDVDGDGRDDTVLRTASPAGCVLAREAEGRWWADVFEDHLVARGDHRCWAATRLSRGAVVLVSEVIRDGGQFAQGVVHLFTTGPGGAPTDRYSDAVQLDEHWAWSSRAIDGENVEIVARATDPDAGAPRELHQTLRAFDGGGAGFEPAGCWGVSPRAVAQTERRCEVRIPAGTVLQRYEGEAGGVRWERERDAALLYPASARARSGRPQIWCALVERSEARWVTLPAAATAQCTPEGLAR